MDSPFLWYSHSSASCCTYDTSSFSGRYPDRGGQCTFDVCKWLCTMYNMEELHFSFHTVQMMQNF